jgi:hypothetical protein
MPLAIQQNTPRTFVCSAGNRRLSKNDPTITSTVPTSNEGMKVVDRNANLQSSVFLKLSHSNRAHRNTPPTFRTAPIGNIHVDALTPPPFDGNNVHRFDNCCNQAWLLKNSCFAKTADISETVNADQIGDRRL